MKYINAVHYSFLAALSLIVTQIPLSPLTSRNPFPCRLLPLAARNQSYRGGGESIATVICMLARVQVTVASVACDARATH